MSLSDDVLFSKAEKAWKPTAKMCTRSHGAEEDEDDDAEEVKTQELFNRLHSIPDKLTPQKFQELMKQVMDLTIDTEERLKGAVDLIFEKAISEPNSSVVYANMCRRLMGLKVPTSDKPGCFVNFGKLLLNRCQVEFERGRDDDEIFEKNQKEIEAAKELRIRDPNQGGRDITEEMMSGGRSTTTPTPPQERERLRVELQDSRDKAHRRSLGNIKFIGELFKVKMLTEAIMHVCIVTLLNKDNEESLECVCMLLSTIGKCLDFEKAKPRMDRYFNQMDQIINERKTSYRISLMLQDVLDLRKPPGPRRFQQGHWKEPRKIISHMSLSDDVLFSKAEKAWKPKKKMSTRSHGSEEDEDDDPEEVKTQKLFNRLHSILDKLTPQKFQELMKQVMDLTIDTEERLKGAVDLILEKAISEPDSAVVYANMCRCLMGLKVPTSDKPGCFLNFRKLLLNRCQEEFEKDQDDEDEIFEKTQKEIEAAKEGEEPEPLRVELQDSRDQAHRRSLGNIKFLGELFKLKMLTEVIMHDCIVKLLKNHDEESLEGLCMLLSTTGKDLDFEKAKPRMDQYFNQMDKIIKERKTSSRIRFMLQDVLDLRKCNWVPRRGEQGPKTIDQIHKEAEMEEHRDHIKVQLQLLSKKKGGGGGGGRMGGNMGGRRSHIPGGGRTSQPQDEGWNSVPISKNRPIDTTRLSKITKNIWVPHRGDQDPTTRGDQGPKTIDQIHEGAESPQVAEDEDVNKFLTEQKVEFTTGEEMESKEVDEKKVLIGEELSKQLDKLIQDKASNQRIRDWAEANLDEQQTASNQFVRALMTSVCQSAIICDNPYRVDARQISQRASLLQRYLSDEQKELQALYALQALMVHMEQPAYLLRMFFDALYDEKVIKEEAFYKWESSNDPVEQRGKGVALKSVTAFFTWLREAEDESDSE